jgi:hypothetical protein
LKRIHDSPDHVVGVVGSKHLGEHVVVASRIEQRTHNRASDNTGTRRSRPKHHLRSAEVPDDVVRHGTVHDRHFKHAAASALGGLANCFGNFVRLAVANTNPALTVTNDDQSSEVEATTALHNFRDTVDENGLLNEAAFFFPTSLTTATAAATHLAHVESPAAASAAALRTAGQRPEQRRPMP